MNEIDYDVKRYKKTLTTDEFYERFFNFDYVQNFCKQCPRYDTNYSCSPVDFDIKEFVLKYDYIDIHVTQLLFNPEDYMKDYSEDELKDFLSKTFFIEKNKIAKRIYESEKEYSDAQSLTGPCNHCAENCKELYSSCQHPEIRRYSLASIGIDSKKILKDLFDIELLLINGVLPKYLNNITSILYKK